MTRTEAELAIVEKIKEIKELAVRYDHNIEYLSMSLRHYDGTDDYFDNEWVINLHSDNHSLDVFVQGGEVYSGRVGSAGEIIAEGGDGMSEEKKDKTARAIIEEVCNEICNHYCKYPDIWDEEKDGELIDTKCIDCPLNKL